MARILRFISNNKKCPVGSIKPFNSIEFSKEELDQAKTKSIKVMQQDMFHKELSQLHKGLEVKVGTYRKWGLYLDNSKVIRCRDRTSQLNTQGKSIDPILVHGKHPFVQSFIQHKHVHSNCSSKQYTLHVVRQLIHGPGLTVAINKLVRQCNICRILRAAPYAYPPPPILPMSRLAAERPFAVCGVDYSGPHFVKEGRARRKIWIALFTCMVSRAIHIETVPDLTADTFMKALQAMAWNKGTPKALMSDNATCFTKADKDLKELHSEKQLQDDLAIKGIDWIFISARAPWFGAIYERLIGVLKKELVKLIGHALLTYLELNLCLSQIQGVINSRPLAQVGADQVISPMNILTGRSDNNEDILNVLDTKEILKDAVDIRADLPALYQQTHQRLSIFWRTFQQQYLNSIRFTNDIANRNSKSLSPKVGDLVIIHSHDPRLMWRKAIILENIPSEDGQVRRCRIKTSTGQTTRAVKHLYPLEINVDSFIDEAKSDHVHKPSDESLDFEGFDDESPSYRQENLLKLRKTIEELAEQGD